MAGRGNLQGRTTGAEEAVDKKLVAFSLDSGLSDCVLVPNTLCGSKWYPH